MVKKKGVVLMRKNIAKVMAAALIMMSVAVAPYGNTKEVKAADDYYTEQLTVTAEAPKPTDSAHKDWLFAGWFTGSDCKDAIEEKSGTAYAKFVPADVMSVKCQSVDGVNAETESTSMRLITTVDNLKYQKVGFKITVGNTTKTYETKTVYKTITSKTSGLGVEYGPSIFDDKSTYFATATMINIPNKGFAKGIFITPYWVTLDGTTVEGVGRYARVEDSYYDGGKTVVNVPVRLYTDKNVAAGQVTVNYDKDTYKYIGTETGDLGDVFEELYVNDNGAGKVTCVGNASEIRDVKADGLLVSLRFVRKDTSDATVTFNVDGEQFANYAGDFVYTSGTTFDVSNVTHKAVTNN